MSCHLRVLAAAAGILLSVPGTASASNWSNPLASASHGQARSQGLPSPPSPVSAACISPTGKTIKVTWSAATHASSYTVYKSTVSATSGYTVAASGITTTTWTSGTLSNATYWFEVSTSVGTSWVSPNLTATGSHTITTAGCT